MDAAVAVAGGLPGGWGLGGERRGQLGGVLYGAGDAGAVPAAQFLGTEAAPVSLAAKRDYLLPQESLRDFLRDVAAADPGCATLAVAAFQSYWASLPWEVVRAGCRQQRAGRGERPGAPARPDMQGS